MNNPRSTCPRETTTLVPWRKPGMDTATRVRAVPGRSRRAVAFLKDFRVRSRIVLTSLEQPRKKAVFVVSWRKLWEIGSETTCVNVAVGVGDSPAFSSSLATRTFTASKGVCMPVYI